MTFGNPIMLLSLLVIPLAVAFYVLAERRRARYAVNFTNVDVLASVAARRAWRRFVAPLVFLLALAAACVAMARPHATTMVPQERATVILVLDVSRSMNATDVKPSRIGAAEEAVQGFLDKVPSRLRVGLIAFAGSPSVVTAPTTDHELVRESLATIGDYGGFGGTAIGDALAEAVRLGQQSLQGNTIAEKTPDTKGLVSILFLSDGAQRNGILQPMQGADRARAAGIPVYTIALGTPNGTVDPGFPNGFGGNVPVPPDPDTLRAIAQRTGGKFYEARSRHAVTSAYSSVGSRVGRKPAKTEITSTFLAVAAGLLAAAGLLSALWSPRIP